MKRCIFGLFYKLKTAFNISSEKSSAISNLFVEISNEGFSYVASFNNEIVALKVFRFDNNISYKEKAAVLKKVYADEDVLKQSGINTIISCSFAESVLSPAQFFNQDENAELLKTLYCDSYPKQRFQDNLITHGIVNDYNVPDVFSRFLKEYHPSVQVKHQYSLLINKLNKNETTMHVLFYFEKIVIVVFKDGNLQIVQSFTYKAPADVVYHLLNVSQQFTLKDPAIVMHGMIEKRSALYEEIYNYFLNISFAELPEKITLAEQFADYPPHFFAHLFYSAL